ncbi:hypothetical protein DMC30DRAFT_410158, partial [Rhodotorula diobovata]
LVSSIQLPQGSSTSRMRSGDVLLQTGSADEAAVLRCTASSAGLEVATPVGRHGLVLHYVAPVEGALEDVVRALEERAPEGREVVRGRPRWLGAGRGDHGSVLVLLWDPALVSTLCSGSGDLLSTSLGRLKCERAREGRPRMPPAAPRLALAAKSKLAKPNLALNLPRAQGGSAKEPRINTSTRPATPARIQQPAPKPTPVLDDSESLSSVCPDNISAEEMAEQAANAPADPSPATAFLEELLGSPTEAGTPPRSSSTSARAPSPSTSWRSGASDAGDASGEVDEGANESWAD